MKKNLLILLCLISLGLVSTKSLKAQAPYCAGGYTLDGCGTNDYVRSFTFGNISNLNTACTANPYYIQFPATAGLTTTVMPGQTIAMTVTGATTKPNGFGVWIDFNRNNVLTDAGELVYFTPGAYGSLIAGTVYSANIVIPTNAVPGLTRLRVRANWQNYTNEWVLANACATMADWGEIEDYTIQIGSNGPPQPPIANFYAPDTVWINSPATLINTSSFQSRVFWDFPNENPLQTGFFRQAGFIDTARFTNNITYTFTSPGLKLVKLLAVNDIKRDSLRDSIFKYIYVDTPSQAPRADFITFKRIMGITEEAQFLDLSSNGPTQWDWIIDPPCISCVLDPANGIANYFVTGSGQPGNTVASPRLAAFDAGLFKVCLRVWNLRGTDSICKSNYIKVVEGNYMCSGSGGFTSAKEEGFLYGISGPYQTYARSSWPSNCP